MILENMVLMHVDVVLNIKEENRIVSKTYSNNNINNNNNNGYLLCPKFFGEILKII